MKKIVKEVIIPESKYTETVFISSDGTEFLTEEACILYEKTEENTIKNKKILIVEKIDTQKNKPCYFCNKVEDINFRVNIYDKTLKNKISERNCCNECKSIFLDKGDF